ncbi:MAG: cell envelope integrity protein TolA [Deltaproteobacteria bacterium]|nr:cell envelope integrity protein TolA [Deltaproteobacteria bacterium]
MNPEHPVILHHAEWDRGLSWMVLLSALAHAGVLVLVMTLSPRFTLRPRTITAYTVDLVSSDQLAGTNLVAGGKGKMQAPPKVEPKPAPPPPPPKVEEVKSAPPPPQPEAKPEPKKPEPKVEEKAVAVAAATPPQPAQPTPTPVVQAKAEVAKPAEAAKPAEVKPKPQAKAAPVAAAPTAPKKPAGPPTPTKEELAARELNERIAKAVERVKNEGATASAGTGKAGEKPGGPISVGPGVGPGAGIAMGVEYIIYRGQLEARLKEAWAWAGAERELEAIVRFRIGDEGEVSDVRITRASGNASYDESVLRAVRAVNPLPPPPGAYRKEFSDVEISFTPAMQL